MDLESVKCNLEKYGQTQLLRFYDGLDECGRKKLLEQLAELDYAELDRLIREYVLVKPQTSIPDDLQPAPFFPLAPRTPEEALYYEKARMTGGEILRRGEVSFLTVAGGQGTRLGFDGPKGTYPICPVSGKSLFAYFAESILRIGEKYGRKLTWYIMTSTLNYQPTVDFFRENKFFGMDEEQVFFFIQGTMPAVGYDGKLLLGAKDSLALSPNGHGGTLLALRKSGALDRMKQENVKYISYFQVDNPLAPMGDELFIGLHALEGAEMSAISLTKTGPFEKLGNFCVTGGKLMIIEYSDLPAELAESRDADGKLRFVAGSPAIHIISAAFVERLTAGGSLQLPAHRADKKVPFVDAGGNLVKPEEPNAVKLETFIFDALSLAEKTMVLEGDRKEVFAPTKNATGVDSVESCREMMIERDAVRLEAAGVKVPRTANGRVDARIELSPRLMHDTDDVREYAAKHGITEIKPGSDNYFC